MKNKHLISLVPTVTYYNIVVIDIFRIYIQLHLQRKLTENIKKLFILCISTPIFHTIYYCLLIKKFV